MLDSAARDAQAVRLESINASWAYDHLISQVLEAHRGDIEHLLQPPRVTLDRASHLDDTRKATDYVGGLQQSGLRLAVRVRAFEYLGRYGHEFVLRDNAPAGLATEADKILRDPTSANLYLYAFTVIVGERFAQYLLVDLVRLRAVWASDRTRLGAQRITFSPTESGLVLGVDQLRAADCVIGGVLAERTLVSQHQARAALQGLDTYSAIDPDQRSRVEILLMKTLFHPAVRIGGNAP